MWVSNCQSNKESSRGTYVKYFSFFLVASFLMTYSVFYLVFFKFRLYVAVDYINKLLSFTLRFEQLYLLMCIPRTNISNLVLFIVLTRLSRGETQIFGQVHHRRPAQLAWMIAYVSQSLIRPAIDSHIVNINAFNYFL